MKKLPALIVLCLLARTVVAQDKKYEQSLPVDLPQHAGWNKVLCMRNGNTLLFHFEPAKRIIVKVFDSTRTEVASRQEKYSVLDILTDEHAVFKGLYDINNEAVLFIDQDHSGKHELVRIRYNSSDGTIVEEKLVAQSQNENKRIFFYLMKNKEDDNYEVFYCMDIRHPAKECDLNVLYYNNKHETIRQVHLDVDRKDYDYLETVGAETQPNGVLITISLDNTSLYGKPNHGRNNALLPGGSVYQHYLTFYYIPKGGDKPRVSMVDVTAGVFPITHFTRTILSPTYSMLFCSVTNLCFTNSD